MGRTWYNPPDVSKVIEMIGSHVEAEAKAIEQMSDSMVQKKMLVEITRANFLLTQVIKNQIAQYAGHCRMENRYNDERD